MSLVAKISTLVVFTISIANAQLIKNEDVSVIIANPINRVRHFSEWEVSVTVKNNARDTLKYVTMSCAWNLIYHADTAVFQVRYQECDKNFPIVVRLNPSESKTVKLSLYEKHPSIQAQSMRIGFNLLQPKSTKTRRQFNLMREVDEPSNLIWSNTIDLR